MITFPPTKIEACAVHSKDSRYYLRTPWFDANNDRIVATDGHKLVSLPAQRVNGSTDITGPIPIDALKESRKRQNRRSDGDSELNLSVPCVISMKNGQQWPRDDNGVTYPDYQKIIPKETERPHVVSFNAEYLKQIADALIDGGVKTVRLHFAANESNGKLNPSESILVTVGDKDDRCGVLMPCRMD